MEEVRLIDANALHKRIEMNLHASNPFTIEECCYKDALNSVDEAPTIDPESLRGHAKWVKDKEWKFIIVDDENNSHEEPAIRCTHCNAKFRKAISTAGSGTSARSAGSRWRMKRRSNMKPINAEEIVRVFNGWLEEADSLAEREAIECCIDHIRDAPAVSQQELRSYMLPWFSPFAAPWCGKIQRAFPKAYVTMNFELILVPRTNTYINLNHCSTPDEFKAEVIEGVSRFAFKAFTKPLRKEHLDGINKLLDTKFTPEDMEYIYTNLGNGINHELCMKFVKSGYDLKVIEESV